LSKAKQSEWLKQVKATTKKGDLEALVSSLREELGQLRVIKVTNGAQKKLSSISKVRKNIARVLTIRNEKARSAALSAYSKRKYIPTDLRAKKTRALRRKLSPKDAAKVTLREHKKAKHFPSRKYAVKA